MKIMMMTSLIAAQLALAAQPVTAAELVGDGTREGQRQGAFAGARVRLDLGASTRRPVRAGLTLAPVRQGRSSDGSVRTRFGEGLELGLSGGRAKPQLSLAGTPMDKLMLGRGGQVPGGTRSGVSDLGWVAIGVGVVVVVTLALAVGCLNDNDCIGSE